MSNIAGKAYGLNVITPMKAGSAWFSNFLFRAGRTQPWTLKRLLGLGLIHFAHWTMIRRDQWPQLGQPKMDLQYDYMLFCSNFNGSWDQYVVAFTDSIPDQLDTFWYTAIRYPRSIPFTPARDYILDAALYTDYYYNATPGSGQRDIKAALKLGNALREVAAQADAMSDEQLGEAYRKVLLDNQGGLAAPGFAPVASAASMDSAINRGKGISGGGHIPGGGGGSEADTPANGGATDA